MSRGRRAYAACLSLYRVVPDGVPPRTGVERPTDQAGEGDFFTFRSFALTTASRTL